MQFFSFRCFIVGKGQSMPVTSISFGQKIPMGTCKIKDIKQNKAVNASLYELDCKDSSDIEAIEALGDDWQYKNAILNRMRRKYSTNGSILKINSFFIMEDSKGDVVGISETKDEKPYLILNYLETKGRDDYKYIGQNMLAFLSKYALDNKFKKIYVPIPVQKAVDFYVKKCGFKKPPMDGCSVELSGFGMKRLQHKVDKNVNSK